ncbi:MAG TPA: SURF1 family protein [Thermomonas sp.]|jgi:surfeit locus 1 family protein|uniref:SURF1 family protein n=1 Tax=Thermomonas sp. TaxID=1971895 RepID=UPI002D16B442|nr:SURF1 family protein [Thermomonas sp.]HOV95622.1 SURF1 family protein [Thermomonas sp.]
MRSNRTLWLALCVLGLAFAGFCALGLWQVQRLHWKHALIARVDSRIHAPPRAAPTPAQWPQVTVDGDEYRHVSVRGHYMPLPDTRVQALTELGPGDWLLSPFQTDAAGIVMINRGFVPTDALTAASAPPAGTLTLTGLLRMNEPGGRVLRRNDPAQQRWYSRDVRAIAQARGLHATDIAPYFIDIDADADTTAHTGWPRAGMTVVRFRDPHLQYALTWFALALMTLLAGYTLLTSERRLRHHAPDADANPHPPTSP